MATETISSLV